MEKRNLNDNIWVHITDIGWEFLWEQNKKYAPKEIDTLEKYKSIVHPQRKEIDGKIYTEFQIWNFFDNFPMRFGCVEDRFDLDFYFE